MQTQYWTDFIPDTSAVNVLVSKGSPYIGAAFDVYVSNTHNGWRLELKIERRTGDYANAVGLLVETVRPGKFRHMVHANDSDSDVIFTIRLRHPSQPANMVNLFSGTL